MGCIFCEELEEQQILFETEHFVAIFDIAPIQYGHVLVITKKHKMHVRELSQFELNEYFIIQRQVIEVMEQTLLIDGVSVVLNNEGIIDTGTHFHIHFIPRYLDDDFWTHQQVVEKPVDFHTLRINLKEGVNV